MASYVDVDGEKIPIDLGKDDIEDFAPWFEQFLDLDESARRALANKVCKSLEEKLPETIKFIEKFKCKLVGICPRIVYAQVKSDNGSKLNTTWVHPFSMPTLLYWCPEGKFGFFVNPNLNYDDTVLNKINGNKKQSLKGFTG